jgi:hypothetical protein
MSEKQLFKEQQADFVSSIDFNVGPDLHGRDISEQQSKVVVPHGKFRSDHSIQPH